MKLFPFFLLLLPLFASQDFYTSDANVYELTPSTFDKVIHKSNYTSVVEFYAPWCGYCKQLKPVIHKLGKFMNQDAKHGVQVAAVNCDKNYNKPLCSRYQVSGFPSVLVFRPPKYTEGKVTKASNHAHEVYQGERSLKPLTNFLHSRIKNYVNKLHGFSSDYLEKWISQNGDYKVLLVTQSQTLNPMYKTLAIDFLSTIKFAMFSTKSLPEVPTVTVNDQVMELPITSEEKLPILLLFDKNKGIISKYNSKLNDKIQISQWIIDQTGIEPNEGELSKKDKKYYSNYRTGKKGTKLDHDEL